MHATVLHYVCKERNIVYAREIRYKRTDAMNEVNENRQPPSSPLPIMRWFSLLPTLAGMQITPHVTIAFQSTDSLTDYVRHGIIHHRMHRAKSSRRHSLMNKWQKRCAHLPFWIDWIVTVGHGVAHFFQDVTVIAHFNTRSANLPFQLNTIRTWRNEYEVISNIGISFNWFETDEFDAPFDYWGYSVLISERWQYEI